MRHRAQLEGVEAESVFTNLEMCKLLLVIAVCLSMIKFITETRAYVRMCIGAKVKLAG